jgi:4'-phosphopantetheinyl transferase
LPLTFQVSNDGSVFGLWRIAEDDSFFSEQLVLSKEENDEVGSLSTRKKTEWLASRFLLHTLIGDEDRYHLIKDIHGKPKLNETKLEISLSHSHDYVAAITSNCPCGIDIQYFVEKIDRISKKFVNQAEWAFIKIDQLLQYLHLIWSAKEAIYKAYGKKGTRLVEEIEIYPFEFENGNNFVFYGVVKKDTFIKEYKCVYIYHPDLIMVYANEIL